MATVVKLKIAGYEDPECTTKKKGEIYAIVNPASYQRSITPRYEASGENNSPDTTMIFKGIGESNLTLSFFVDGTGIISLGSFQNVDDYIEQFKDLVCGYKGDIHRPYYLLITWGQLSFTGVCTKIDIKYNLFTPSGYALRATIDITVSKSVDYKTKAIEAGNNSPDLTHIRTVRAGDTLPLMVYRIYGDSSYYMEVARKNGLGSCWDIKPGDTLYFPPLKK